MIVVTKSTGFVDSKEIRIVRPLPGPFEPRPIWHFEITNIEDEEEEEEE